MAVEEVDSGTAAPLGTDMWEWLVNINEPGVYVATFNLANLTGGEAFVGAWSFYESSFSHGFDVHTPIVEVEAPSIGAPAASWAHTLAPLVLADGQEGQLFARQVGGSVRTFPYVVNRIT